MVMGADSSFRRILYYTWEFFFSCLKPGCSCEQPSLFISIEAANGTYRNSHGKFSTSLRLLQDRTVAL
jgi:hypothetical protein